jgi:beta-glucosidase
MTIEQSSATMLNGGIDMFMMGQNKGNIERLIKNIKKTLSDGELFVSRLDDAVTKVIAVKMAMGLVENVKA